MINIVSVNYNSNGFIYNAYKSLMNKSNDKWHFHIWDNGSNKENLYDIEKWSKKQSNVTLYFRDQKTSISSLAHGDALNESVKVFDSKDMVMFFDNDCYMLIDKWNEYFTYILKSKKVYFLATNQKNLKSNVPSIIIYLSYKNFIEKNNIDFRPKVTTSLGSVNKKRIVTRLNETGHELANYKGWYKLILKSINNRHIRGSHFIYSRKNKILIASHFNQGRKRKYLGGQNIKNNSKLSNWMFYCENN